LQINSLTDLQCAADAQSLGDSRASCSFVERPCSIKLLIRMSTVLGNGILHYLYIFFHNNLTVLCAIKKLLAHSLTW